MIQWHPYFAHLLRPLLEPHFAVRTGGSVGDAPREADIVLVCRTANRPLPYQGVWRHLTTGNVLEFKGPTVSPRRGDLERLVELGLGVHRRLNEERAEQGLPALEAEEVSFWYLGYRLGKGFLRSAQVELDVPGLEPLGPGFWRCRVLRRLVFLVSGAQVPVDRDSLPMHVLGSESKAVELEVARVVGAEPPLWQIYSAWVLTFHPAAAEELRNMARRATRGLKFHLEPLIEVVGLDELLRQIGPERLVERLGPKQLAKLVGIRQVVEALGTKKLIEELGTKKLIEELGTKKVVSELAPQDLFDHLTPAQLREIKRRLK